MTAVLQQVVEKPAHESGTLMRRAATEAVASAFLLATVIGSGIMAERLAGGNVALALLANTIATGAMLAVLITIFGPVSGAHMNPAVSIALVLRGELAPRDLPAYILAQIAGAVAGAILAHAMFGLALLQVSTHARSGAAQWLSEAVATFGLLMTVFGCAARAPASTPWAVGLYITAAYWFTASTSFANPAVTIARAMTDTFSGIAPAHVPGFIAAQLLGAACAIFVARAVWPARA